MKRVKFLLILCVCFVLTGCNNDYAQKEYDAVDKIVKEEDRYVKSDSSFSNTDDGYSIEIGQFDGRQTLWSKMVEEDKEIEINIQMSLSEGTAKVVHTDDEGNVNTIVECTPDNTTNGYITQTVSLKSGLNRIKIVGVGCKDIKLELLSPDL